MSRRPGVAIRGASSSHETLRAAFGRKPLFSGIVRAAPWIVDSIVGEAQLSGVSGKLSRIVTLAVRSRADRGPTTKGVGVSTCTPPAPSARIETDTSDRVLFRTDQWI